MKQIEDTKQDLSLEEKAFMDKVKELGELTDEIIDFTGSTYRVESSEVDFGYKVRIGSEIFTVPHFGNILKFIKANYISKQKIDSIIEEAYDQGVSDAYLDDSIEREDPRFMSLQELKSKLNN